MIILRLDSVLGCGVNPYHPTKFKDWQKYRSESSEGYRSVYYMDEPYGAIVLFTSVAN